MSSLAPPATGAPLHVARLSAGYDTRVIVHDITLTLHPAEIFALVGPNGAGKSTLLKAVIGLASILSGSAALKGEDIQHWPAHQRARRGIAYLMQGGAVFPSLPVSANLDAATADLPTAARAEGIADVLNLFSELRDHLERRAGLLSGGQRQMLALAMVFARRPRVVLLDEPSAGLSPRLMDQVLDRVQLVCRASGASVLLVEQNVRAALSIAQRAGVMDRGRLVAVTSTPRAWLEDGALEHILWGEERTVEAVRGESA